MKRINSTKTHNNKYGYRGIWFDRKRRKYVATICGVNKRGKFLGRFATPEEAALAYDDAAKEEYGDAAFLNFPLADENKTIKSRMRDGHCPEGHEQKLHGKTNSKGEPICKKCQAMASNRYYHGKKTN